ncbi:pyridoxine-5'-phosphate oxidase-like [Argiope bruennichi]|uniref:pyridoxal 5'-phosphate synthase n=1 Tax=Argiope bruennichi TaxID=94029 RepID=A0A8T0ECV8_ARGBR|nr:pyridoxine-5'-phosphate oxidase-like [Argiope bruennichi]KAF8770589.1 Pyridoxine-5'-phosphate oxidase like protein [Argiope bruennichi]
MDIEPEGKMDLGAMRVPYEPLLERDFSSKDPIKLFDRWFNDACKTDGIREANAMAVATADKQGKPSVRYVLLKSYSKEGFIFYTNYNSRKGREIAENPQVALLFYWEPLCRQIRIEGSISKHSQKESEDYFHSRPKSSQLSAVVSNQSEVIENKEVLIKKREELEQKYADESAVIPKPDHWGGYLIKPDNFEFWCGRSDRLHDRIKFRRPLPNEIPDEKKTYSGEDGWVYEYLSP